MKKFVTLLLSLTLLMCATWSAFADEGGYTITNYQVSAVLYDNNTVTQTEVIDVNFSSSRHGIYRSIPQTMYVGRNVDGESVAMEYRNQIRNVSVEGAPFETESEDGHCNIRIGDADETVIGDQRYTISFTYSMPDDRLDSGDFLFYSVLGSEWGTTIDHFSFDMTFYKPIPQDVVSGIKLYSGSFGGTENALDVAYQVTPDGISGEASNIAANQAITIFTDLPEGYFTGERTISPIPAWIFIVLTLLLGGYTAIRALTTHREKPVQTVEFYPPDGISSAEVGYIIDNEANESDLLSLIPWWAQKGYITIEEKADKKGRTGKHSSLVLHKKKDLPGDAPQYMRELFGALFVSGDTSDLKALNTSFAEKLGTARSLLSSEFVGVRKLYTSKVQPIVLIILTCLSFAIALTLSNSIYWENSIFQAMFSAVMLVVLGIFMWIRLFSANFAGTGSKVSGVIGTLVCIALSGVVVLFGTTDCVLPSAAIWAAYVVTVAACLLAGRMTQPTPYNVTISGKLMGLKHFIETAELPRLKELLADNPSYYYDVLPYAMVFGLTDQWANQFKELTIAPPNWYMGYNPMFNIWYFNTMMRDSVQTSIAHVKAEAAREAAKQSASSGGGGGFSGGGGGGGGGGSW